MEKKTLWMLNHYALPPDLPGGTRHFDLACELTNIGYDVTIFASAFNHKLRREVRLQNGKSWGIERIEDVNFVWVKTFPYQENSWRRLLNMISFMVRAYFVGRELPEKKDLAPPDIIIGSSVHLLTVLTAYLLSCYFKAHFVMEVRDLWPQTLIDMGALGERNFLTVLLHQLEKFLYQRAERIIVLLPNAGEYIKNLGADADKICWIPNGVNLSRFVTEEVQQGEDERFTVMYAGAHGQANGLDVILDAASIIQKQGNSEVEFVLIGDGPEKTRLKAYCKDLELANVEFCSPVAKDEVPIVLAQSDVLVFPLKEIEVFKYGISSNKLFDYLASGKPIVFSCEAANNIVDRVKSGVSVPPEDPQALADAIIRLYSVPPEERQAMGARGRAHVEQHYDTKVLAGRLHHMLEDLVNESSAQN
jgi:glycosyltransferase involved in cell wall biosynthesis